MLESRGATLGDLVEQSGERNESLRRGRERRGRPELGSLDATSRRFALAGEGEIDDRERRPAFAALGIDHRPRPKAQRYALDVVDKTLRGKVPEDEFNEFYSSLVSINLSNWERDRGKGFGKTSKRWAATRPWTKRSPAAAG